MTSDGFRRDLVEGASCLGLSIEDGALESLVVHQGLLRRWSRSINLTGFHSDRDMAELLYLDSAVLAARCLGDVVDVGTGAGFPGMIVKVLRPSLAVTLLEARHKRVAFLRQAARTLDLTLAIEWGRLEEHRGLYTEVISRAVFPPEEWVAKGPSLVGPGGRLWVMVAEEMPSLAAPPGFGAEAPIAYVLPFSQQKRHLMAFRRL